MAITINSTPENLASLHDDLYFVATSTNAAQPNFKYVFDVRINGVLVSRIKLFPEPISGKGVFNASNIVRNYWTSYFKPNASQTAFSYTGNDIYVSYVVQVGEEYNGTLMTNLASSTQKAYNFAPPMFRDYASSYLSNFDDKFITNRDKANLTYHTGQKLYVSYFQDASGSVQLTANGTTGSNVSCQSFVLLDISPEALNTYFGSIVIQSGNNYTVTIGSQTLTVTHVCPRFDTASLHFLNELGGYDTFSFRLVNKQSRDVERKKFDQKAWELSGSSMVTYDSYKRRKGGNVNQAVKMKLTSDYVSKTDHDWLRELITSPEVYYEKDGYYYPVSIVTSNWEEKLRVSDKNFNLTLDIELGNTNSQYR